MQSYENRPIATALPYPPREAVTTTVNSLVAASDPLFNTLNTFTENPYNLTFKQLHNNLIDEIEQFQETANKHCYAQEAIVLGCYALCATVDERLTKVSTEIHTQPISLIDTFQFDINNMEEFATLLAHLCEHAKENLALLELLYICLSLGFRDYLLKNGLASQHLDALTNRIYEHIRYYKGAVNKKLVIPAQATETFTQKNTLAIPLWLVALLTFLALFTLLSVTSFFTSLSAKQTYETTLSTQNTSQSYETTPRYH